MLSEGITSYKDIGDKNNKVIVFIVYLFFEQGNHFLKPIGIKKSYPSISTRVAP